jgi:hypothetical protein
LSKIAENIGHNIDPRFRRKYNSDTSRVLFVLATDDLGWSEEMFGDVDDLVFTARAEEKSASVQPAFDLAVMAQCNHSIIRH